MGRRCHWWIGSRKRHERIQAVFLLVVRPYRFAARDSRPPFVVQGASRLRREGLTMRELKCPSCGYLNPDIRELGYTLPATCGRCTHIWRFHEVSDVDVEELARRLIASGWTPEPMPATDDD